MYVLRTGPEGRVTGALHGERWIYPTDASAWDDVDKWAADLDPPLCLADALPQCVYLFLDRGTLVDFCKRFGIMLHATGDELTRGVSVSLGNRPWISLMRAVAILPEDETPRNTSGITSDLSPLCVPESLFKTLSDAFKRSDDKDPVWCISSKPVNRAFVYLDVSAFSKYAPGQEALIINTLVRLVNEPRYWNSSVVGAVLQTKEAALCIGDGYIYAFTDALDAAVFAGWLAELIQQLVAWRRRLGPVGLPVAFHFRMGVHYGPVYRFWDPGRENWNYIGEGINGGNRVLSVIDKKYDDIVFISDEVVEEFIARGSLSGLHASVRNCLENRGREEDKHGKPWRVYLLNHTKLCEVAVRATLGFGP